MLRRKLPVKPVNGGPALFRTYGNDTGDQTGKSEPVPPTQYNKQTLVVPLLPGGAPANDQTRQPQRQQRDRIGFGQRSAGRSISRDSIE